MASSSWPAAGLHGGQPCDVQDDNAAKENSVQSLSIRIDLDLWLLEQFFRSVAILGTLREPSQQV